MIEAIKIVNFKSIKSVELSLRPINVLIGSNGAGKSNFVNFFGFVNAIRDGRLAEYTGERGGSDRIIHLGKRSSSLIEGMIKFDSASDYKFVLVPNDQDSFYTKKEFGRFLNAEIDYTKIRSIFKGLVYKEDSANLGSSLLDRAHFATDYLRSFSIYHFHDTSRNAPLKQTARLVDNETLRADGSNLPAFLYQLQQTEPQAFNRIEALIRTIAPYFERFDLRPNGDYIRLNWRQKGTDMYLDASDLSDGTIRFVALCTLLAQPNPPKTIIIDEPELGLHPYAISVLAELVKSVSEQTQIILSTQSVNLVNEFEPEDIIVVENQANESTFKRLDSDSLSNWLEEYTLGDLWNKNVIGGNP